MSPLLIVVIVIVVVLALLVTLGMGRAASKGDELGRNPADRWGIEDPPDAPEARGEITE